MTRLSGPLLSFTAQGSIAGELTYQKSTSRSRVTSTPTHTDADTPNQQLNRADYISACAYWSALHDHMKEFYNYLGAQVGKTGFNYCVASYMLGFIP